MKSTVNAALALALAAALTGCAQPYVPENGTVPAGTDAVSGSAASAEASSEQTAASDPSADNALNGNNHHKITTGGEYTLKGDITKRVKIDANGGDVHIILDNVVISTKNEPAIYVKSAGTVRITLADGTSNSLSVVTDDTVDASDAKVSSAIYSKSDIIIDGGGTLSVSSYTGNGIRTKGAFTSENAAVTIACKNNGISADGSISFDGGRYDITADGNDGKAIKSDADITINADCTLKSGKDSLNAGGSIVIGSGDISISSGDDAFHADDSVTVKGGNIGIIKCCEGIEAQYITIDGGKLDIVSTDDGINATDPNGTDEKMRAQECSITVNGGEIHLNTDGDGFDTNGTLVINGGTVTVDGPQMNDNAALDATGGYYVNGGTVIAVGSAGMSELPEEGEQNTITVYGSISAGSEFVLKSSDGTDVVTYIPLKDGQAAFISSPDIVTDTEYTVYSGNSELGSVNAGKIAVIGKGGFGGNFPPFGGGKKPGFSDGEMPGFPDGEIQGSPDGEFPTPPDGDMPPLPNGGTADPSDDSE